MPICDHAAFIPRPHLHTSDLSLSMRGMRVRMLASGIIRRCASLFRFRFVRAALLRGECVFRRIPAAIGALDALTSAAQFACAMRNVHFHPYTHSHVRLFCGRIKFIYVRRFASFRREFVVLFIDEFPARLRIDRSPENNGI